MTAILDADLIVIGAGMAGLTAAARVAEAGHPVIVVERSTEVGGSAALSGGHVWTVPSVAAFLAEDPMARQPLATVLVDGFADVIEWIRVLGVELIGPERVQHGVGYRVDIVDYLDKCAALVAQNGGHVLRDVTTTALCTDDAGVIGVECEDRDGPARIRAPWTLLATGGWQNDAALRTEFLGEPARDLRIRSNPVSRGDGLRLAESVGAARATPARYGFYGHLVAAPLEHFGPSDYRRLAQLSSDHCVLVNRRGRRFTDESRGDHHNAPAVLGQPGATAALILDAEIRDVLSTSPHSVGALPIDRVAEAETAGAHVTTGRTWNDVADRLDDWGFDGAAAVAAVQSYNQALARNASPDSVQRARRRTPIAHPPFTAMQVEPAITFGYGGIAIDEDARVLDSQAKPIPGLLSAGADAAGVYDRGYAGGLALAAVFASRAARLVLAGAAIRRGA